MSAMLNSTNHRLSQFSFN